MKFLTFWLCLLISPQVLSEDWRVEIKDFSFKYDDPKGSGEASHFSRNQKNMVGAVRVEMEKIDKDFAFKVSGSENQDVVLKQAPDFLVKARTMNVQDLNFSYQDELRFNLGEGEFLSEDDALMVRNFSLNCDKEAAFPEVIDQVIAGCIRKLNLNSSSFSSELVEESLVKAVTSSVMIAVSGQNGVQSLGVKSLNLTVNAGKFELAADVKAQISGKVKGRGFISYDQNTGRIAVKITEVKFGILNVTGKVFDELKKQKNDKLVVKEPNVFYQVK